MCRKHPGDLVLREIKFRETNHYDVKEILNAIKPNKAMSRAVHASRESIAEPLSKIINTVINSSEIPTSWKKGEIQPHYKKDSKLDKTNYRPNTILPAFSKVLERVIHIQMSEKL